MEKKKKPAKTKEEISALLDAADESVRLASEAIIDAIRAFVIRFGQKKTLHVTELFVEDILNSVYVLSEVSDEEMSEDEIDSITADDSGGLYIETEYGSADSDWLPFEELRKVYDLILDIEEEMASDDCGFKIRDGRICVLGDEDEEEDEE